MKLLLIGCSGFIGTNLSRRLLHSGHDIRIFDKRPSQLFNDHATIGDIRDTSALEAAVEGVDAIYNLAAEHRDDVRPLSLYYEVNVQGAKNVVNAAEKAGVKKIIFTSSVAVYGFTQRDTDETGEFNHFNEYGRTKLEAEMVYQDWVRKAPDRSLTIIRPTVVFGEGNRGNVFNLLRQIASGKFIMVGNGRNHKSMAYVGNIAGFLEYALDFDPGERIFNYADKPDFDMNTLISLVNRKMGKGNGVGLRFPYWLGYLGGLVYDIAGRITGKKFSISVIRMKKFCSNTQFSSASIHHTEFTPPVSLQEGIERTIQFEFLDKKSSKHEVVFYTE